MLKRILLSGLVVLLSFTHAQKLTTLLPEKPIFALGISDLEMLRKEVVDFTDVFEKLEIGEALVSLISPQSNDDAYRYMANLWLLVCDEAWLTWVNVPSEQFPVLVALARIHPDYAEDFASFLKNPTAENKKADNYSYNLITFEQGSNIFEAVAYTLVDDILIFSSNENTLQEALVNLGSETEASFATSKAYQQTLGYLKLGQVYNYLDYGELAVLLGPLIQNLGLNKLTSRLTSAISTLGVSAGVTRLTGDGMVTESIQLPNAKGGDKDLYRLLTQAQPASDTTLAFVPSTAFAFNSGHNNLDAWWRYLDDLVKDSQVLGSGLDDLLLAFFGLDVKNTFLNWAGKNVTTVTTNVAKAAEPGLPSENLLGETVYIIETSDEVAMERGLGQLFTVLSEGVAAFADPQGGTGNASSEQVNIAGTEVSTYNITGGLSLSYTITEGYVLIATSLTAMQSVLEARDSEDKLETTEAYKYLASFAPEDASSFGLSNTSASMESAATQLSTQLELFAGLGGAANLDFDQVEQASASVRNYLSFIASCLGYNVAYTQISPEGTIYNYGETQISWQCNQESNEISEVKLE